MIPTVFRAATAVAVLLTSALYVPATAEERATNVVNCPRTCTCAGGHVNCRQLDLNMATSTITVKKPVKTEDLPALIEELNAVKNIQ